MSNRISVIGAGLGGLSAAIRLAVKGFEVSVYEKNSNFGGKMNEMVNGAYRFDTGPSILTMPFVIDELFKTAGFEREDFLKFKKVDPVCRNYFYDGSMLDIHEDYEQMLNELQHFNADETGNYQEFISYSKKLYESAGGIFLQLPIHEWRYLKEELSFSDYANLFKIDGLRSMHQSLSRYFKDERLIQLFDRYATYSGSDPFKSPATLNMIPYVEIGMGAYYIQGGMYRLVEALEVVARKTGVKIYRNEPVEKIVHKNNKVQGVSLNGELVVSEYVVCNADVISAHRELIDGFPEIKNKYDKLEPSLSGMVFFWGVREKHPQLKHHNILFSKNYRQEFTELFNDKKPAVDPTIYIAITSKSDSNQAPAGSENWFVLVNMPYLNGRESWPKYIDQTRQAIFSRLNKIGIDVKDHIDFEKIHTPLRFKDFYGSNKGSIYGISSNSRLTTFLRPANRSRKIAGLYFAGGSSHPGGGIPLVVLSGKMVADLIDSKFSSIGTIANKQSRKVFENA